MIRADDTSDVTPGATLPAAYLHDLRTPLNQILGYSEMLTEQAQEEGQDGFLPDLRKINAAGRQLLGLLNGVAPSHTVPVVGLPTATSVQNTMTVEPDAPPQGDLAGAEPVSGLILVVDDNPMNRDVLSRRLVRQGYSVVTAENGREAIAAVRARSFDLVLLDIMMPEMDGYEALRRLKADETLKAIPVIMISALEELDSVVRCIKMGAEDYLPKPFNPTLLKARIGACLEKKRAHDRETKLFNQCHESYVRLQELEKLRDDLTHMIIHDLRTPLTSVISGMQTLEVMGDLNADQQEMTGIALQGGETLLGMINDLLDVSKMETGALTLDYELVSPAVLVASAVGQVARLATSHDLTIVQDITAGLPLLTCDESKLRRTLVNLLGNAIKFTPATGTITVDVRLSDSGTSLVFAVSDTGEGIPSEAFAHIFEKFGQVESRQLGRKMSTGLGLTFCKLAVEAHGGEIAVESVPDQGSTFCFTIPLRAEANEKAAA